MKPTVIIAGFFPPPVTGQGLATARLVELLSDSYHVVSVNLRLGESEIDLRVARRFIDKIGSYREAGRRLKTVCEQHPNAVVFWTSISPETFGHFRDLATVLPAFGAGHKVFAVVHWGRFSKLFESSVTRLTAGRLMNRLDGVVFLNENRSDDCAEYISAPKRFVIPNTLDDALLCSDEEVRSKQLALSPDRPLRILYLSHMIREKGYDDLLVACQLLQDRGLEFQATFAGQWITDSDRVSFENRIVEFDLADKVKHVGPVSDRDDVKKLHLESDVFVLPSYMIEGQPLAIIEAMNAGSPIVSTRLGGTAGMIESGDEGYLVEPQAPGEIADAIEALSAPERWLACSNAARKRYQLNYGAEPVRKLWTELASR